MCEQVEGFGLPFKMSLRATVPYVGAYSKLRKDMGNYILAGVRNLSISHSQNDQKCTFGGSFGQLPFQAHCDLVFEEWGRFSQALPLRMSLRATFPHVAATSWLQAST